MVVFHVSTLILHLHFEMVFIIRDCMNELPKRKHIRIEDYDYSTPGAYFITVCVNDRKPILWNVGAATCRPYVSIVRYFAGGKLPPLH